MAREKKRRLAPLIWRAITTTALVLVVLGGIRLAWVLKATERVQRTALRAGTPMARWIPSVSFRDGYEVEIPAPPEQVWAALWQHDWRDAPLVGAMLVLHDLPRIVRVGDPPVNRPAVVTLDTLLASDAFVVLEGRDREYVVIGSIGRPWESDFGVARVSREDYLRFSEPGYARMAWRFEVMATPSGTRLEVEWRSDPVEEEAERTFARYWRVAGPLTGLLGRTELNTLARRVESGLR